jgi:glycerol-3-phosphate acyltransferase PlsY
MDALVALVVAYLIGSIDFGVIVPRAMGIDIYDHGSGNPGTSNVFRTLGKKAAAVVLLGDALKGFAAVAIASAIGGAETTTHAAGVAAVLGHVFPIWHRFKGGRGVATAIGAAIWLEPWFGIIVAIVWAGVVVVTKTASIASIAAMVAFVPGFAIGGTRGWALVWVAVIAVIVLARHWGNIKRILERSERTVTEA